MFLSQVGKMTRALCKVVSGTSRSRHLHTTDQTTAANSAIDDLPLPLRAPNGVSLAQLIIDDRNQD
jgi:hypothetical protein